MISEESVDDRAFFFFLERVEKKEKEKMECFSIREDISAQTNI